MATTVLKIVGNMKLSRVFATVMVVIVTYGLYRWLKPQQPGIVRYKTVPVSHQMPDSEIEDYIYALQDTRPQECRTDHRDFIRKAKPKISIVVDFHNMEFYQLKLTLESILRHTSAELYQEIVLLDDGSDHEAVMKHAEEVLQGDKFHKLKAYRSDQYTGRGLTRLKASHVASGDILVFVSSDVVVNVGWLEPLVVAVLEDSRRLVVPHQDNFLDGKRFYQMDDRLVSTFSWPLTTVYMENIDTPTLIRTPVMRGEVLATTKSFLDSIGNYDSGIKEGGGNDLELSLRTWMCGGEIYTSICSRVATHVALKPREVTNAGNFRRIAELWLDSFKPLTHKQGRVTSELSVAENIDLNIRRKSLKELNVQCKSMDWYLNNVATNINVPGEDMEKYGKIKVSSSYCAQVSRATDGEVDLVLCRPYIYDRSMMFTLDTSGRLRSGKLCMMGTGSTSRAVLSNCQDDNRLQLWKYHETGLISSLAFPEFCLTHTTLRDRELKFNHNFIQLATCKSVDIVKQTWVFVNF